MSEYESPFSASVDGSIYDRDLRLVAKFSNPYFALKVKILLNLAAGIPTATLLNPDCELKAVLRLGGKTPGGEDA